MKNVEIYAYFEKDPDFNFDRTLPLTVVNAIIPNKGITEIDEESFIYCTNLNTVLIPASIKTIGKDAFKNCEKLDKVYYDGTLDDWLDILFENEYSNPMIYASEFYILDEKGTVEYNKQKYSLVSNLSLDKVTHIKKYQFVGFNLESISLSNSIVSISNDVFKGCTTTNLYYDGTINDWCIISFVNVYSNPMMASTNVYFADDEGIVSYNNKKYSMLTSVEIPLETTLSDIKAYAFAGCKTIKTLETSVTIRNIGDAAFYGCTSLEVVNFKSIMSSIGKEAFAECSSLSTINYNYLKSAWNNIKKGKDWNKNISTTKVKCSDGYLDLE